MKTFLATVLLAGLLILASGSTYASLHSFDFNGQGYTDFQMLEGTTYGLATLTSEGANLKYTTGYGGGLHSSYSSVVVQADGDYYFDFSSAVSNFWFRGGDGGGDYDAFSITLYQFGTNNFLGTYSTPLFDGGSAEDYSLLVPLYNIGRVVVDPGNGGTLPGVFGDSGGVMAREFGYNTNPIPEPATMILVGLGLAGTGLIRRKRAK